MIIPCACTWVHYILYTYMYMYIMYDVFTMYYYCMYMYLQDPITLEKYQRLKAENDAIENVITLHVYAQYMYM